MHLVVVFLVHEQPSQDGLVLHVGFLAGGFNEGTVYYRDWANKPTRKEFQVKQREADIEAERCQGQLQSPAFRHRI